MMHTYKTDFLYKYDSDFYYILGAFMTDGSIYYNPKKYAYRAYLYSNDKDWLENINTYFSDSDLIYKNRKSYVLTISNKQIVEKFIEMGCIQNKSLTLKFPNIPEKYFPDFMRGCLDGDGCIGIHKFGKIMTPCAYLCGSAENFMKGFLPFLENKKIKFSFLEIPAQYKKVFGKMIFTNTHYKLNVRGKNNIKNFLSFIYYFGHNFSMPRKNEKVKEILKSKDKFEHTSSKLDENKVLEILKDAKNGIMQKIIAKKFNVSQAVISDLLRGRTWKSITKIKK